MKKKIIISFVILSLIGFAGIYFWDKLFYKTYDCSIPNYYNNVQIDRKEEFVWNENISAYVIEIPELCIKLISRPYNDETDINNWREYVINENNFENFIVINNNSFSHEWNKYRFYDKEIKNSLDKTIQENFFIRPYNNPEIQTYLNQQYCIVSKQQEKSDLYARPQIDGIVDEESHYSIIRPIDIFREANILNNNPTPMYIYGELYNNNNFAKWFWYYNSNFCGSFYPVQEIWFDNTKPYGILYNDKYPTRYFLYPEYIWQSLDWQFFANITIQYLD